MRQSLWVFGGIDRKTKDNFVVKVNRKMADSLENRTENALKIIESTQTAVAI